MSNVFTNMEKAFQLVLDSIPNHPYIDWENDKVYRPVLNTRFWRPTNLPFRGELATMNMLQKHQGVYQIDVFAPAAQGIKAIMKDLDSIYTIYNNMISLYEDDTRIDILNIGRGRLQREDAWCRGFIEIYYMCYSH